MDDLGFETGEADGVVGRDGRFPAGDVDLLSRRCNPGDRREQEPGATSGAVDDHAVSRGVEVVDIVDRFGISEQIDGDVETVDLPRLERSESWIGDRRCHNEAQYHQNRPTKLHSTSVPVAIRRGPAGDNLTPAIGMHRLKTPKERE